MLIIILKIIFLFRSIFISLKYYSMSNYINEYSSVKKHHKCHSPRPRTCALSKIGEDNLRAMYEYELGKTNKVSSAPREDRPGHVPSLPCCRHRSSFRPICIRKVWSESSLCALCVPMGLFDIRSNSMPGLIWAV